MIPLVPLALPQRMQFVVARVGSVRAFAAALLLVALVSPLAARAQEPEAPAPVADPPAEPAAPAPPEAAPPPQVAPPPAPVPAPVAPAPVAAPPPAPVAPAPVAAPPPPPPVAPAPVAAPPPAPAYAPPVAPQPAYPQPAYAQPAAPPPAYAQPAYAPRVAPPPAYAQPAYAPQGAAPAPLPGPPAGAVTPYPYSYYQPYYQLPPPAWPPRYAETPSYQLPPLPSGYAYVPTALPAQQSASAQQTAAGLSAAAAARNAQLYDNLRLTDDRLATLQRDRIGVGGPITMLVIGYGAALIGSVTALSSYGAAESIEQGDLRPGNDGDGDDLDFNEDGRINGEDEDAFRRAARISSGVAAAGLVVGILGTGLLSRRKHARAVRVNEVRDLKEQRANLRSQLEFGTTLAYGQVSVSMQGRY